MIYQRRNNKYQFFRLSSKQDSNDSRYSKYYQKQFDYVYKNLYILSYKLNSNIILNRKAMNIQGDSLLSNISNISGKIKLGEESSLFNFSIPQVNHEKDQGEKLYEVKIDDIYPFNQYMQENNSIFDRFIKKEERQPSIMHFYENEFVPRQGQKQKFNKKQWKITQRKGVSEDQYSSHEQEQPFQIIDKRLKNETKNIPKNYGKAIITFIQKYRQIVASVCYQNQVPFIEFYSEMSDAKKTINSIADLRKLWVDYKYAKCMRIISNLFLRKYALGYIFNSRICNFSSHIKYRQRLRQAVRKPQTFRHIKDY